MTPPSPPLRAAVATSVSRQMADQMLVFYGSYRSDRLGIRLADFIVGGFRARGESAELIDAKAVGLPMLDRMYKEYPAGTAPPAMETLAAKIRTAHAFIFVVGEYNWGMQPGLRTSPIIFWRNGFGVLPRSSVTLPGDLPELGPMPYGMGPCPKWAWW